MAVAPRMTGLLSTKCFGSPFVARGAVKRFQNPAASVAARRSEIRPRRPYRKFFVPRCRICSAPEMPADSNREVRTPPEHESEPGARSSPVSADAAAAVESLEKSAASNVQSIGYGGGRANGVQHNSHQYTPMLPFPEAGVLLFHADIATRGRPSPSHRRARRCSQGWGVPQDFVVAAGSAGCPHVRRSNS